MATTKEESLGLLHDGSDTGGEAPSRDSPCPRGSGSKASYFQPLKACLNKKNTVALILFLSGAANAVSFFLLFRRPSCPHLETGIKTHTPSFSVSAYGRVVENAGLDYDPSVEFPYSTGYGPEVTNHSLLDERWEAIDINPGVVAISDDWAAEHNLAPTQRFPWDNSKGVYLLTAFHTLHCLKNIHRLLYEAHHGRPFSRDIGHAMHCLDHMRKDAMCDANDFLLPSPKSRYGNPGPQGQSRVCKDWDGLVAWAEEHSACYQHISDDEEGFEQSHDEIERYKNCAPSSPYYQTMKNSLDSYT